MVTTIDAGRSSARTKGPNSKEKVMLAATELFSTKGFGRTSIDEILKAAHVTKSNFYYHFASKEILGMEVLKRMQEVNRREIWPKTLGNPELGPYERIEAFVRYLAEALEQNGCNGGCPFANLAIELSDEWPTFREHLAEFFRSMVAEMVVCIREGQECGQIRRDVDPHQTAQLLFAQLEGAVLLAKTYKNVAPVPESFQTVSRLIRTT